MTETHQPQALLATLRATLHQLADTLERTREDVDAITSQVTRLQEGVAALGALRQREATAVGIDMLVDAAAELLEAFRALASGIPDAQGDIDTLEAAPQDDEHGQEA